MAETAVSDAVCFPQDDGTGVPDNSEDFDSAGYLGLLAQATNSEYVGGGLDFTNVDTTDGSETVDITAGHAFILADQNSVSVQSGSQTSYDTTLPDPHTYLVILPTTQTITLDSDATNKVFLYVDPASNDSVTIRHGSGIASPQLDSTPKPALELGTVDSADGSTTRNRDGVHVDKGVKTAGVNYTKTSIDTGQQNSVDLFSTAGFVNIARFFESGNVLVNNGHVEIGEGTEHQQRGKPSTSELADGQCMTYCSDGSDAFTAGDLVYAVNDGGTVKTLKMADRGSAT